MKKHKKDKKLFRKNILDFPYVWSIYTKLEGIGWAQGLSFTSRTDARKHAKKLCLPSRVIGYKQQSQK